MADDDLVARQRLILDGLRRAQDAHHAGDQQTAGAVVEDLVARFGEDEISRIRLLQARDQLAADMEMYKMFGVAGLRGDD